MNTAEKTEEKQLRAKDVEFFLDCINHHLVIMGFHPKEIFTRKNINKMAKSFDDRRQKYEEKTKQWEEADRRAAVLRANWKELEKIFQLMCESKTLLYSNGRYVYNVNGTSNQLVFDEREIRFFVDKRKRQPWDEELIFKWNLTLTPKEILENALHRCSEIENKKGRLFFKSFLEAILAYMNTQEA